MIAGIALLLSLVLSSVPSRAADLTIYCEYPPPDKVVEGSKGGLVYDEVWELMRRTGIEKPVEQVSWKRGYDEATSKPNVGLFPTTRTAERENLFHWVGPILRVQWVFYGIKGEAPVINSLDDAKRVRAIGTYANDGKEQWLKAQGFENLVSVMDNVTNLKKLYDGRIDLMVGSPSVTDRWPDLYGYDPAKLVMVYPFKTVDLYLAVSKGTDEQLVWQLRKAFADMREDGSIKRIYAKWVPGLEPPRD